jgi:DnaK suppressor protein
MSMMDDRQRTGNRDRLRHELETRRRRIVDDMQRGLSRIRQADARVITSEGPDDDTSDIDIGVVGIMNATVDRIDAALERLADGGYGLCTRCHRPISEARLRALPFAVRCQACEAAREHDSQAQRTRAPASTWEETHGGWRNEEG